MSKDDVCLRQSVSIFGILKYRVLFKLFQYLMPLTIHGQLLISKQLSQLYNFSLTIPNTHKLINK